MQEKRLRQLEERARGSPEAGPPKDPAQDESKRKVPDGGSPSPPPSAAQTPPPTTTQTPPPSTTQTSSTTTKLPVRKLISLRSKAALGRNGDAATATTAVSARGAAAAAAASTSLPTNQSSALQQQTDRDALSQAKRARTLPPGGAADLPAPRDNQEKLSSPVKGTAALPSHSH